MREPCICGDTHCSTCGPLQGNFRCEICDRWTEDGGCENPSVCNAKREHNNKIQDALDNHISQFDYGPGNCGDHDCPKCLKTVGAD